MNLFIDFIIQENCFLIFLSVEFLLEFEKSANILLLLLLVYSYCNLNDNYYYYYGTKCRNS